MRLKVEKDINIDYAKIAKAIIFYQSQGYQYLEVPWLVSKESIDITKPKEARYFNTSLGQLVGSGEQSFFEIKNQLKSDSKYVCATPCFRDEQYDELHLPSFFKVELIHVQPKLRMQALIKDAFTFFLGYSNQISVIGTEIGQDIMLNGIELGSYGRRSIDGFDWEYGTGCAEPRLSQALHKM